MPKKTPQASALARLAKKEGRLLEKKITREISPIQKLLSDKVPPGLQNTLRSAFRRAFDTVFLHGNAVIAKSFSEDKHRRSYALHESCVRIQPNKKHLRAFSAQTGRITRGNAALSGAIGTAMGLLGIGLPDIPLFTAVLLKNIYETALENGFDYRSPGEQYFILLLIEAALSSGDEAQRCEILVNAWITAHRTIPAGRQSDAVFRDQLKRTADTLSDAVLYMKFVQGIPIIGAAGGFSDAVCISQVGHYASLKYERRRLTSLPQTPNEEERGEPS